MLFLFQARLEKPAGMTRAEFYGLWEKESEAAMKLLEAGEVLAAYKIAGADELIAILDIESLDRIDTLTQELPIWRLDAQHLTRDIRWTPLRDYGAWYHHLKVLSGSARSEPMTA